MLDVQALPVSSVSGQAVTSFRTQVGSLPVPERHYTADVFFLSVRDEMFFLLFGQMRIDGSELRNLLIIKIPPDAVSGYLRSLASEDDPVSGIITLESLAERQNIAVQDVPTSIPHEPKETVSLNANMVLTCASGRESCLDFYYASPFSKGALPRTQQLAVDPVVRINIPTSVLVGMNRRLEAEIDLMPESVTLKSLEGGKDNV